MPIYTDYKPGIGGTFLPEEIPLDNFSSPIYAALAQEYWRNESNTSPIDTLPVAGAKMGEEQLLALVKLMQDDFPSLENNDDFPSLENNFAPYPWANPREIRFDSDGKVHAVIGTKSSLLEHVARVVEYVSECNDSDPIQDAIIEAGYRYRGEEFGEFLDDMLCTEYEYRYQCANIGLYEQLPLSNF